MLENCQCISTHWLHPIRRTIYGPFDSVRKSLCERKKVHLRVIYLPQLVLIIHECLEGAAGSAEIFVDDNLCKFAEVIVSLEGFEVADF